MIRILAFTAVILFGCFIWHIINYYMSESKGNKNSQSNNDLKTHPLHPFIMEDIGLNYVIRCADCGLEITLPYELKNQYRNFLTDNYWIVRNSRPYCPKCCCKNWRPKNNNSQSNEFL